jgi:glutamate-5-semialdehyde dehydrogenase
MPDLDSAARGAKLASRRCATLDTAAKNTLLRTLADDVRAHRAGILAANTNDLAAATAAGLPPAKLARLALSPAALDQLEAGLHQIADLPDPVGRVTLERTVPSGLRVRKVRSPLGVILMIFEARPAVTLDAFALCFKSGNACILKGGRESTLTSTLLAGLARNRLRDFAPGLEDALVSLPDLPREDLPRLLALKHFIDLAIPRGGPELIAFVAQHARMPTVLHERGVCHVYIDRSADPDLAERVCVTAKTSAPAACNAAECLLLDERAAPALAPRLVRALTAAGVEVRACPATLAHLPAAVRTLPGVVPAMPEDFGTEFLAPVIAMRTVAGLDEAIAHVQAHGSDHTEAILTRDTAAAAEFTARVHASCVVVNASTRFNDGFQLGLGAEIGISTTRVHAYGPMGLEELTTQRWIVEGNGQTR